MVVKNKLVFLRDAALSSIPFSNGGVMLKAFSRGLAGNKKFLRHRPTNDKKLSFQSLEDRRMLATFSVTSSGDGPVSTAGDLPGSLRQAIFDANANPGDDTIEFDSSVFTGGNASLVRLTQGELEITDSLTIDGSTGVDVTITGDANGDDVVLAGGITDVDASEADLLDDNSRVLNLSSTSGDLTLSWCHHHRWTFDVRAVASCFRVVPF